MGFVDKQQHRCWRLLYRLDNIFQPLLELTFDPRPGLQQAQVQGAQTDGFQAIRHVTFGNAQRQPFNQGGFTHTRFTDQNRVVFTAARQDVDHLADLGIATKNWVNLPSFRFGGDVQRKFIQRRLQGVIELRLAAGRGSSRCLIGQIDRAVCQCRSLLNFRALVGLVIQQR
ncbi:Protein of uncharacterised function (DUF3170) [Yersinia pseudotuberculosis]|nr:Protein of uncharacterised function (DUF3170) [Yersinia pseudotuberculosis]